MAEAICLKKKERRNNMSNINQMLWKDFLLTDFFTLEKGNQNNMASLKLGNIPLVSAKKCDNGYKDFVAPNKKKLYKGGIITLNNDGDGGAGIAYYQPHTMALDSHVTALIPKLQMNRHHLLFVAMCITKQRSRFGHGYSLNSNRLRSFRFMLPVDAQGIYPDWKFMEDYMKTKEQQILKPTIEKLCKHLIINNIVMVGVNCPILIGKHLISQKYLLRYNEVSGLKKPTTQKVQHRTYRLQHSIMEWTDLLEMKVA